MTPSFDDSTAAIQLQQAMTAAQHFFTLLVQGWAALIATDAILLGYAVAQRQAWVILIAAAIPASMIYVSVVTFKQCLPLAVVGLRMESALRLEKDGIFSAYLLGRVPDIHADLAAIAAMEDGDARMKALERIGRRRFFAPPNPGFGPAIAVVSTLAQIAFFIVAVTVFNYRFM